MDPDGQTYMDVDGHTNDLDRQRFTKAEREFEQRERRQLEAQQRRLVEASLRTHAKELKPRGASS
jgi:hypothetical protein